MQKAPRPTNSDIRLVAEFMLSPGSQTNPEYESVLRAVTLWSQSMSEAKKRLKTLTPGPPSISSDMVPILAFEGRADILISCFAQTLLEIEEKDPAAFDKAFRAATEVSEIVGFRALVPLFIALTGEIVGPDLGTFTRMIGASEIAVRCYAAVSLIKEWREDNPHPPKPRPAFLTEMRRWAEGLLGERSAGAEFHAFLKAMDAAALPVVTAVSYLYVFRPDFKPLYSEETGETLSRGDSDVALLCFAQIYRKAQEGQHDPFQRALTAAIEVSRMSREDLLPPLLLAVTGFDDWPFEPRSTFDMIGADVVTERIKSALNRIQHWKARLR